MRKVILLLTLAISFTAGVVFTALSSQPELSPAQRQNVEALSDNELPLPDPEILKQLCNDNCTSSPFSTCKIQTREDGPVLECSNSMHQ